MISLSSPPVARYLPPQDQRTQFTQADGMEWNELKNKIAHKINYLQNQDLLMNNPC